ncbi:MAG: hypothetical protein IJT72_01605 [Lachnospiraceae bacterium]|nr:hypothetical protein [Lachnospiraceae bacterium]
MGKKKIAIIISLIAVSVAVAVVAVITAFGGKKHKKISNDGCVTAGEWIEILADHTGCDDIALPSGYSADSIADGKLIAITAMKTVDEHKYKRIIDDIENYGDDDYYKLAMDYGLLSKDKKSYTLDECDEILLRYNEIYYNDFWLDDYGKVEYVDGVRELSDAVPVQTNEDYSVATFDASQGVSQGDVIVFTNENGSKVMRRVDSIDETGACHMSQPDISEVVTELDVCDKKEITFDDVINLGAVDGELISRGVAPKDDYAAGNSKAFKYGVSNNTGEVFSYDTDNSGFTVTLSAEEDEIIGGKYVALEMEEHSTGNTAKWMTQIPLNDDAEGEISIGFSNISLATDTTYFNFAEDEKYAEYRLDMDTTISGSLSLEADVFKVPLFHFNVPFEAGFVNLDFTVYLEMTAEGKFEISATFPTRVCVRQEKNKGLKLIKGTGLTAEPSVGTSLSGEVMLAVALEAKLNIFWIWDIISAEIKAGALASIEVTERDTGMICTDFNVAFPVVKLTVEFNGLIEVLDAEFNIVSPDDAPYRWNEHYEKVPGVRDGKVPECSYGNDELFAEYNADAGLTEANTEEGNPDGNNDLGGNPDISKIYGHDLYSRFDINITGVEGDMNRFDITDTGSGYILGGTIYAPNRISSDRFNDYMEAGTFTNLGTTYTVVSKESVLETRSEYTLLGDDGITYMTGSAAWLLSNEFGSFYDVVSDNDGDGQIDGQKIIVIENAKIFVPYDMAGENIKRICEYGASGIDLNGIEIYGIKLDEQGNLVDICGCRESILYMKESIY